MHHEQAGALAGWIEAVRSVAELPGNKIRSIVAWILCATGEIPPDRQRRSDVVLAVLSQEGNVGRLGKIIRAAANIVAICVNDGEARPGEHVGMGGGAFAARHVVVVVTEAIHHAFVHSEGEGTRLIVAT